jgi:diketogulonate reductase-like aldo/keto reductase
MPLVPQLQHFSKTIITKQGTTMSTVRSIASSASGHSTSRLHHERPFIYGTAWKKDQTKALVKEALVAGFRSVDTAAQPRHYQEHLVGEALREAYLEGIVERDHVYVSRSRSRPFAVNDTNM